MRRRFWGFELRGALGVRHGLRVQAGGTGGLRGFDVEPHRPQGRLRARRA